MNRLYFFSIDMAKLKLFRSRDLDRYLSKREGELKFGEKLSLVSSLGELSGSNAKFVLFGIPEDIGVRANHGNPGTAKAWDTLLQALLNVQDNLFNHPEDLLLLGNLDCSEEMEKASNLEVSDPNYFVKLGELVDTIDWEVSEVVETILMAGKTPIVIGGGHNNAFGNIKGAATAMNVPINVLNIDAHTDLRQLEHRHSGNGFSYARDRGYLKKYAVFGLHQNYTPQYIYEEMLASEELQFHLFEDLQNENKTEAFDQAIEFAGGDKFGLELDCDSIADFPSSAVSPSGFHFNEVREFVKIAANDRNCIYFHICEAAPEGNHPVGKALSYLVTDFMRLHTH